MVAEGYFLSEYLLNELASFVFSVITFIYYLWFFYSLASVRVRIHED